MPFCLLLFDLEFTWILRVSQLFEHILFTFSAMCFIIIEPLQCYITQTIQIILIHMYDLFLCSLYLWRCLTICGCSPESLRVVAVVTMNGKDVKTFILSCLRSILKINIYPYSTSNEFGIDVCIKSE